LVARATAKSWYNVIAGLVVGVLALPACALAGAAKDAPVAVAQLWARGATKAHNALNDAIEAQRRGDYEAADRLFQEAQKREADLTQQEREELARLSGDNALALQARKDGASLLRQAQQALQQGRGAQAADLLKNVAVLEQYLIAADKTLYLQLGQQMRQNRPGVAAAPAPARAPAPVPVQDPKVLVSQARAQFQQHNWDAAEGLAHQAEKSGAQFSASEDSPRRILDDIQRAHKDRKALLLAARAALARRDFDVADLYAHEAESASGGMSMPWADSPAKVLKEIQVARSQAGPMPADLHGGTKTDGGYNSTATAGNTPPLRSSPENDKARALLRQGRAALDNGDLVQARRFALQASDLRPNLHWSEDTPDKLLGDVARAEAHRGADVAKKPAAPAQDVAKKPTSPSADVAKPLTSPVADAPRPQAAPAAEFAKKPAQSKDEAVTLVKQGRQLLAENKLDAAAACGQKARAMTSLKWGLFEDSPDALLADVEKAQARKGKDESAQVLAEARRLFERGDYAAAEREAYRAKTMHGNYTVWELGDRPDKLLADIQAAREKGHKPTLPPPPVVAQNNLPQPSNSQAPSPLPPVLTGPGQDNKPVADMGGSGVQEAHARQMLAEARQSLQLGDTNKARLLADKVRAMHVVLNKPGDDTPEAIYRALAEKSAERGTDGPLGGGLSFNQPPPGTPMQDKKVQPAAMPNSDPQGVKTAVLPSAPTPVVKPAAVPNAEAQAAQSRALLLMAEAHQCLREDRLVEARQKVLEAQKVGAIFRPDQETPELLLQQIAARARQKVDGMLSHAKETFQTGSGDPLVRLQRAEDTLGQARQLATTFGQDAHPVEQVHEQILGWAQKQGGTGPGRGLVLPPPGAPKALVSAPPAPTGAPASTKGLELINKARLELRSGETALARRFAEEACQPQYGVRDEAVAILRSIDTEEFNQKRLRSIRAFDAAWSAYVRRDYAYAGNMIAAIDTRLLDENRQLKLRDMMASAEMQPAGTSSVVQAGSPPKTGGPAMASTPSAPTAKQDSEVDLLKKTVAMREIKFQQLRSDSLKVQADAAEKYRSGQPDAAIELLQEHLATLQEQQLEPGQLTLLRRPVESRLQQFKLLRAQEEFASRGTRAHQVAQDKIGKVQLEQQNRQKQVADLMKQFNTLYKEGKYTEAESMAARALELDPDNGVVSAAIHMARIHSNRDDYNKIKEGKENMVLKGLNDSEKEGPFTTTVAIDKETSLHNKDRPKDSSFTAPYHNESEKQIERQLSKPVTLSFSDTPLKAVIEDLRLEQSLNIYVDTRALDNAGISLDRPVSVKLDQVSLKSVLNLLLRPMHLTYVIKDEVLQITTEDQARGGLKRTVYQVADLVIPVENFGTVGSIQPLGVQGINPNPATQPMPSPVTGPQSLNGGAAVGQPTGSMANANSPFATQQTTSAAVPEVKKNTTHTNEEVLIKLIQNNIEPKSWAEMGGPGTIDFFPHTLSLVVNQTPDIQDQIRELLDSLRRLQDQEVAVEVRFITLAEEFFERIGVNFNLNFVNHHNHTNIQPNLVSGNFAPDGFLNNFQPKNFLSGLTPAGTLTPDLNIPLNVLTYPQAIPPFGGYPGIPGFGGVTMGLAFLSDIQVFLFMEAAQGDQRTNVMQAPKLTLFNGQTATLTVTDSQFFLTGVQVIPQQGIFTYTPQIAQFPLGVTLAIQAVISADRRFVRLSLTPTLTNLASPIVSLFPVVVPIFPLIDNTGTGQPIVFTQFIQQPRVTTVAVLTTVAVPDGGTVLMGGLKRLSEGRNEYGPPVLSKVPFINRLFKNVGYGREAESLLIMVTPRIIIQAEEEERQTGVVPGPGGAP
jgi:type II secretory pathway component GspD/PulD (secretin)